LEAALNTGFPLPLGFASQSIIYILISITLSEPFADKMIYESLIASFIILEIVLEADDGYLSRAI